MAARPLRRIECIVKRKYKSRTSRPKVRWTINWLTVWRAGMAALWLIGAAGLVAGWIFGVPRLEAYVSDHNRATAVQVRFAHVPKWMSEEVHTQLLLTAKHQLRADPLMRDDLAAAREALMTTGWFIDVSQVRRVEPGLVEIRATFADPYALIRDREGDHLVDRSGRLLPMTFETGPPANAIVITGAGFDRPVRAGQAWEGADVEAALQLLHVVNAQPWRDQVVQIDASEYLSGERLSLLTATPCRIIWGRSPTEQSAVEVPASQKVKYLTWLFENYQRIDMGHAGTIDIRGDKVDLWPAPAAEPGAAR